eukprot:CAMPEP_0194545836 /NCGR_PEP_ID=MMETSP0253-20130528/89770_1 /TAXON_ID=2966 /ORGANISM="Noctiluca scintillans" /LENGTH=137 /DNA_ID=CAMNT_0039392869 /DNA_START=186 /DNA_END=599 /DNA_ORIENTATION=+
MTQICLYLKSPSGSALVDGSSTARACPGADFRVAKAPVVPAVCLCPLVTRGKVGPPELFARLASLAPVGSSVLGVGRFALVAGSDFDGGVGRGDSSGSIKTMHPDSILLRGMLFLEPVPHFKQIKSETSLQFSTSAM